MTAANAVAPNKQALFKQSNDTLVALGKGVGLTLKVRDAKKALVDAVFAAQQKKFLEGQAGNDATAAIGASTASPANSPSTDASLSDAGVKGATAEGAIEWTERELALAEEVAAKVWGKVEQWLDAEVKTGMAAAKDKISAIEAAVKKAGVVIEDKIKTTFGHINDL